jgi:dynein heavy chain
VFQSREAKTFVQKQFNKLCNQLIEYESLWFQAWQRSTEQAKKGLRSRLIVADPKTHKLVVNFDQGVLVLIREARHLQLMGFEIPNSARMILLLEDKLRHYYAEITHALELYNSAVDKVTPITRSLLTPHLQDLERAISPAVTTMTWTSMNIDQFLTNLRQVLSRFEHLVTQINDITTNRIEKNLTAISNFHVLNLPPTKTFLVREFYAEQKKHVESSIKFLVAKNVEVERAVNDLIEAVVNYPLHESIQRPSKTDVNWLRFFYCNHMYHALLSSVKRSLNALKRRVQVSKPKDDSSAALEQQVSSALFEVDMSLQEPNVIVSPSLQDIHDAVNTVAREVLQCSKSVFDWGVDLQTATRPRRSFFEKLASDKHIAIVLLLLTGSVEDTKCHARARLEAYSGYSWLWTQEPDEEFAKFAADQKPILDDWVAELQRFVKLDNDISSLASVVPLGSLNLRTANLKAQFKAECERWKFHYAEKLHQEVKADMENHTEMMHDLRSRLEREVKDFTSLKFVMDAQRDVREMQSWIESKFSAILEKYETVERFLPFGTISKDEMDGKSVLRTEWAKILGLSDQVQNTVNALQGGFRDDLMENVKLFKINVETFKADYTNNGPMVQKITPQEAITRLSKYKREFETLNRKYELYNGGEKLFGLSESKYDTLDKIRKELRLLDQLYSLYQQVISTVDEYKNIPWADVVANINEMNETVEQFNEKCKRLPRGLKQWDAYTELASEIENFIEVLPLLTELSKPAMRQRHWQMISNLTGHEFDMEKFSELKLKQVLEARLLDSREDIEEITDSAEKQLAIEQKLQQIRQLWDTQAFEFATWKNRGDVILGGTSVTTVVELLEDSQSSLIQMLTQRHIAPFKEDASAWLKKLSDVNDVLDQWVKVQQLWMSLEAVFIFGDISRQMPQDTRMFMKWDKEWTTRLMNKAKDVKNVVDCCQNEYIKNMLPTMHVDLEKCQKALDGYLEAKRAKFPRFYFVSNPALLQILSQGSDKEKVQQCFAKVFDAIDRVEFQGNSITKMRSIRGGKDGQMEQEEIPLSKPVPAKGNIEDWLNVLLREMARSIKDIVRRAAGEYDIPPIAGFIKNYCAQVALLGVQFLWTSQCTDHLNRSKHDRQALTNCRVKQEDVLAQLSQLTLDANQIKTKMERTKIETLVTIQVHQRDVLVLDLIKRFRERKRIDTTDFEWQKQLRCYWSVEDDDAVVKIADVDFTYCYEYLGCKERLVVTALTDRCYISLSQALGMGFGGAPAGPAGTGKTETVKDLGRALGKMVVVFNCSDQMRVSDTMKIYKGLCQSGSWGCFDEFNRIDLEVLSVVAQQVQAIFNAIRAQADYFIFPGDDQSQAAQVLIDPRCGIFITMNPGYAGRQELPENLKALFRSVAMMVPESDVIIKVKLSSVGYMTYDLLCPKFYILYKLCEQQLSKQRHYDFGLRNILSVLRTAGDNLRYELDRQSLPAAAIPPNQRAWLEEMIIMRTLRDMNLSKLVSYDVGLFLMLLLDLFPAQTEPEKRTHEQLEPALAKVIAAHTPKILPHPSWVTKCIQLYETSLVRHGLMMVGPAGSGKTMATKMLLEAMTETNQKNKTIMVRMNPKAIASEQMFGQKDPISGEWTDGVFSKLWEKFNDSKKHSTWLVCDGPVDAIWIENLNTVLDDNKILTLASGDRLPMTDNVRLLFEAEDLRNASPATVSRAGIIFVSHDDLGWEPVFESWLVARSTHREEESRMLRQIFDRLVVATSLFEFLKRNTRNVVPTSNVHLITNLCTLLEGLLGGSDLASGGAAQQQLQQHKPIEQYQLERVFTYALCWSLGGLLEQDHRVLLNQVVLQTVEASNLPLLQDGQTLWDFFVNPDTHEWHQWEAAEWNPLESGVTFKFSTCLVPTADSERAQYLIDLVLDKLHRPVLLTGSSGTAKTSVVLQYAKSFESAAGIPDMLLKKMNFSSATTHNMFQRSMEADLEKGIGKVLNPPYRRWMTVFLDDVSMPEMNKWGDQPTLEIVRQLIETGGFYSLDKDKRGDKMQVENVIYVAAMTHPGGGRNDVPNRFKRHFYAFNMLPPSQQTIDNIYGQMLTYRFEEEAGANEAQFAPVLDLVHTLTATTIELWSKVRTKMLPTPSRFHYIFNMRDLSRIFQGVLHCPLDVYLKYDTAFDKQVLLVKLWRHEVTRVLSDKLTNHKDKQWFADQATKLITMRFGQEYADRLAAPARQDDGSGAAALVDSDFFVNFLRDAKVDEETDEILEEAPQIYEEAPPIPLLRQRMEDFLEKYNQQTHAKNMNLVLFDDALEHVVRISRIIGLPRGSALLVGVGGSGRQSLTRLAAYIARQDVYQIQLTANYKMNDFLEDVRKMQMAVGKDGKHMTWILTDFEIVDDQMLEYVNALLATGEIAGLFPKDERDIMCAELRTPARKENPNFVDTPDNKYKFFVDRVRDNLHIVLCFSPANEKFAERARRFPGIINNCTINWFLRWPEQALTDVSMKFLTEDKDFKVNATSTVERQLGRYIANVHQIVTDACEEYFQKFRRQVYVTPKSYLSYIQSYKKIYRQKHDEITQQTDNVAMGLQRLKEAEIDVENLKVELVRQNEELAYADQAASAMLVKLEHGAAEARTKKDAADRIETKCLEAANIINKEKALADQELAEAMPYVRAAETAASGLTKQSIGQVQKYAKPPALIKIIMDCVLILLYRPLDKVQPVAMELRKNESQIFIGDSYESYAKKTMVDTNFMQTLTNFVKFEKDRINEETMEFLEPYLSVPDFNAERAKQVANAAESLCMWVRALASYHIYSIAAQPKIELVQIKTNQLEVAQSKLAKAKAVSQAAQGEVDKLQASFQATMQEKSDLEDKARATQAKMTAANNLIQSLGGEKKRWNQDALIFAENKKKLVGDCALACAFISYLGPFNHHFRQRLLNQSFYRECVEYRIPVSKDLRLTQFLVDDATIAEWNSQGLPKDDLSIQNGILVNKASRYPLLIDPQGQAVAWIKSRENDELPWFGTTTVNNPKLREQLEFCMGEGKPLIVEGVVKDIDPMFDPVLDKNVVTRGRQQYIVIGEKQMQISPGFRLYLITKLANPLFSPELSAKTTIVDFSVTQKGLEDQLLSRVIMEEQQSLEDQRKKLIEEVNQNTISLQMLDKLLLERLSSSAGGRLLDDVALIGVLSDTKIKAQEVHEKIDASKKTEDMINKKREQYRPVATRGSVVYFVVVSLAQINCMYQTSLAQFLSWFDFSLKAAEQANNINKRVENLMSHLTYNVYRQINQGLFERDKLTFRLMVTMRIMQAEGSEQTKNGLTDEMVQLLLHGGAALTPDQLPRRPEWLQPVPWQNIVCVSQSLDFLGDLKSLVEAPAAEKDWRQWYESEAPEELPIPRVDDRLQSNALGAFMRLLVVRSFRPDRLRLAATKFIAAVLGERYVEPVPTSFEEIQDGSGAETPIVLLLTPGADPTSQLEELAKRKGIKIYSVSMGEGQDPHAAKAMRLAMETGAWALLQNCHLGLGFMSRVDDEIVNATNEDRLHPSFRLWITCEPHPQFPVSLLQMSVKVTNEPPRGMKAGLLRSFQSIVDSKLIASVEAKEWRDLVFCTCFLHSAILERRKFGPIGWCISYEFSISDLEASLKFLEKHFFANQGLNWDTIRYMICQVQYGGRITDEFDRKLFTTFGDLWLSSESFQENKFTFGFSAGNSAANSGNFVYKIPAGHETHEDFVKYINTFPAHDSPDIFGLHQNAELTFGDNEAKMIFDAIADTLPKQNSSAGGGKTREEQVYERADDLLKQLPKGYVDDEVRDRISQRPKQELDQVLGSGAGIGADGKPVDGFTIPLNMFLYQEINRLNGTIRLVRQTLRDLKAAIQGEIIMTPELQNALDSVYQMRPPQMWYIDPSGAEIAWVVPNLSLWFTGLLHREAQLTSWLMTTRPVSYWLTGFYNPQGFLTATRQEVTRKHKADRWTLDDVLVKVVVTDNRFHEPILSQAARKMKPPVEGVYIHGLYLEGASFDKTSKVLKESPPREPYVPMPMMQVSAITSADHDKLYKSSEYYDCPVYTKKKRTNLNYVFSVKLKTEHPAKHWTMRGVALLCSKD